MTNNEEPESPGWEAIDKRLADFYRDQEPKHYGTVMKFMLGGPDPIDGVSVFQHKTGHLHYISYGLTELYKKESDDPHTSGFGFELTMRLADADFDDPPMWPIAVMNNLARYVFKTGNRFDENHHLPLNSKIALEADTDITAIVFQLDPELEEIGTPHGDVKFLQIVGLTTDEYEFIQDGYYNAIRDRVCELDPLMPVALDRKSILADADVRAEIEAEPPSLQQCESFGTHADFERAGDGVLIKLGATRVRQVVAMMNDVLSPEQPIVVYGNNTGIALFQDDACSFEQEEEFLTLRLTADAIAEIAGRIQPTRGSHEFESFAELQIEIVPVEIKDQNGDVAEVVG